MPDTITASMGVDTTDAKKSIGEIPETVKRALHQATTHTTSFSDSFSKLFSRGDLGERRFHGLVASVVRDLSTVQGGAQGAAQAVTAVFTRITGLGFGVGAALVGVGVVFERLVARGVELEKQVGETNKALVQMGHVLSLSTAAEGFSALAEKARQFHKDERKARDEANKEEEHSFRRSASRLFRDVFRHPFRTTASESGKIAEERARQRQAESKFAEAVRKETDLAVQAQQKQAEIAKAQLSGSLGQVEALKLQLQYIEKLAQVEALTRRDPQRGAEAKAALDAERDAQEKLNQRRTEQQRRDYQAQTIQGQFERQQADIRARISDPQQASELAAIRVQAAQAEVAAAQKEVDAAEQGNEQERMRAALRMQSAQTAEVEARTEEKLTIGREEQARRDYQAKLIQGQFAQQQAGIQGRIIGIQNSALSADEKQLAIARERVELANSSVEAAQAEVQAAQDRLDAAQNLTEEERRQAQIQLQSAQTREIQARNAVREAAGGVAEERARQLEQAGREEEMSPQEKMQQFQQRQKQYEGLIRAAARQRLNPNLIEAPKYGEAEWEPLRRFKAAAAEEAAQAEEGRRTTAAATEQEARRVTVAATEQEIQRRATGAPLPPGAQPVKTDTDTAVINIAGDVRAIKQALVDKARAEQPQQGQPKAQPGAPLPAAATTTAATTPVQPGVQEATTAAARWLQQQQPQQQQGAQPAPTPQVSPKAPEAPTADETSEQAYRKRHHMPQAATTIGGIISRVAGFTEMEPATAKAIAENIPLPGGPAVEAIRAIATPQEVGGAGLNAKQQLDSFEKNIESLKQKDDPESKRLLAQLQSDPEYLRAKQAVQAGQGEQPTPGAPAPEPAEPPPKPIEAPPPRPEPTAPPPPPTPEKPMGAQPPPLPLPPGTIIPGTVQSMGQRQEFLGGRPLGEAAPSEAEMSAQRAQMAAQEQAGREAATANITSGGMKPEKMQELADRYIQDQMGGQGAGVDRGTAAAIQQNIEANQRYWARPDVQGGLAAQQEEPAGEARTEKGGEWRPMGDYGPQAAAAQPPSKRIEELQPSPTPTPGPELPQPQPPQPIPTAVPPPQMPGGSGGGGPDAGSQAIIAKMTQIWG